MDTLEKYQKIITLILRLLDFQKDAIAQMKFQVTGRCDRY